MGRASAAAIGAGVAAAAGALGVLLLQRRSKQTGSKAPDYDSLEPIILRNGDMEVHITPVGASIQKLLVKNRQGSWVDVVLGYNKPSTYATLIEGPPYFGAIVGRCANRIARGKFTINGKDYQLATNNGPNALHGGPHGFHVQVWTARKEVRGDAEAAVLTYNSPDGEEGYPGNLSATVVYELSKDAPELKATITATTDQPTPVNLAQHSYFNLAGHDSGDILGHVVTLAADHYTPVGGDLIPTGQVLPVAGTPYDFTTPHAIGERVGQLPNGYDHNLVLFGLGPQARFVVKEGHAASTPRLAATVVEPGSGLQLEVLTTAPAVQFYTGGFLGGELPDTKGGCMYPRFGGFCLETQNFPDAVNQPLFPTPVLQPGREYKQEVVYRFSTAE